MARIENHKYTIDAAFRECFYVVPDYQREYVWTEKQIIQLLEDINEGVNNISSDYFIGNIIVSPRKTGRDHFDIIDGQQRLTTAFLILCALRVLFDEMPQSEVIKNLTANSYTKRDGRIKTSLKLNLRYENAGTVVEKIVQNNYDPQTARAIVQSASIPIYGSVKNILNAYDIIYHFLKDNYGNESKLIRYWGHLASNVVFIQISTNVSSALKIFETINERGVGLNPMDLLKNLLFTQVSPKEFPQLKDEWKKITSTLEKEAEKPLRFLRYFIMANYIGDDYKNPIIREDEIYNWFSKKENARLTHYREKPFEFVRKINLNADLYTDFSKSFDNSGKPSLAMDSLKMLAGSAFRLHYVLLLAAANFSPSVFNQFVDQIESFLFYYIFTKTPSRDLERNFSIWADEVRCIARLNNLGEQREKLNKFIDKRFSQNMNRKTTELEDALKRLTLHSMQKYRIRYLLARLTQHVDMARMGLKKRDSLAPYFGLQIEHILPNNPNDNLLNKWQEEHNELPYDDMKNRLGNLTLLEQPINIVAGNDFYENKLPEYAKSSHYLTKSLSKLINVGQNTSISRINKKLCSFDKWGAEEIERRQLLLIELSKEIWKTRKITG